MAQAEIWTERLFLRAAEDRDLPYFNKWFSDPVAMKYWSTPPHATLEETKKYLGYMLASPTNGVMEFAICLAESSAVTVTVTDHTTPSCSGGGGGGGSSGCSSDGDEAYTVIGKAGLWDGRELGYMLDREYWGKGYMFEALDAILRHVWALDNEKVPEAVVADVDPENAASVRLLRKLGFKEVGRAKGTYETALGWRDSVFFEARRPVEVEMEDGEIENA